MNCEGSNSLTKKQLHASEQHRPDIAAKRQEWKVRQLGFDPEKLVFLDETSAKTNMARKDGHALRGERLVDHAPHGHWMNTTLVCGLRCNKMVSPHVFMGAMNKKRFVKYLKRNLLPVLNRGDLLVMDNLSSHKVMEVENLLRKHGVKFLYLPGYSPDLNPIELSFSKLKSVLRKEKIRDVGKLHEFLLASGKFFSSIEGENYFKHERYTVHKF